MFNKNSSESEYREPASSSVLQMGISGGSGHSIDGLVALLSEVERLDWDSDGLVFGAARFEL